jgi:hypothetical protein
MAQEHGADAQAQCSERTASDQATRMLRQADKSVMQLNHRATLSIFGRSSAMSDGA